MPVRDHCHLTGKYRGAAHNACNLKFKIPKFTPVIFHNLANCDSHLFIKNLGKTRGEIKCIPNNEEKYISFSKIIPVDSFVNKEGKEVMRKHEIRFIDSFKFMASSLDRLVSNLTDCGKCRNCELAEKSCLTPVDTHLKLTKKGFRDKTHLFLRKGVYPYDYMTDFEKFKETCLPPKEAFYSKLNECDISDEDHEHAQRVMKELYLKNLGEYHDVYLKSMSFSSLTSLRISEIYALKIMISIPLGISRLLVWPGMRL